MRKRSTPIGEILVSLGRISPEDVERALAHQREEGGYFGDALVALGLVTAAEVNWGLADQYDLPFVNLRPDGIDREVASRVPPIWAREHLVLPVLRDGDTVTAVLSDPRDLGRLAEVEHFTGAARVEAALATPAAIRELIDAVHGEAEASSVQVAAFLLDALESGAGEVGVSVRGRHALGWVRRNAVVRRPLEGDALAELRRLVSPFPEPAAVGAGVRRWSARVALPGGAWAAECHLVGDAGALEWAAQLRPAAPGDALPARVDPELRAAVSRALVRGPVLVEVSGDDVPDEALPGLPALLLDREVRSVHLTDRGALSAGALTLLVEGGLAASLAAVRPFTLDALTLDVEAASDAELRAAREAAPLVVLRARSAAPAEVAPDFRLRLTPGGEFPSWVHSESAHAAD